MHVSGGSLCRPLPQAAWPLHHGPRAWVLSDRRWSLGPWGVGGDPIPLSPALGWGCVCADSFPAGPEGQGLGLRLTEGQAKVAASAGSSPISSVSAPRAA